MSDQTLSIGFDARRPGDPNTGPDLNVLFAEFTPDVPAIHNWAARLSEFRIPNSGEVERYYFRSLYFREPNGIVFEIATDGPGFAVDEPLERLGERLALPPFLESRRASIEARLRQLE